MSLLNNNFIDKNGNPITGRTPTQLQVYAPDGYLLSDLQHSAVMHVYKLFCDSVRLSPATFHVQNRELSDGTKIRMESNNGVDRVMVWPTVGGGGKYVPFPAFFQNSDYKSATWTNLPYVAGKTLAKKDGFRTAHPGNRTWYDSRGRETRADRSRHWGLVLSWWGLGNGRYDSYDDDPLNPYTDVSAGKDFYKLWCNGKLILELPPEDQRLIVGACLIDPKVSGLDGPRLCVVTCDFTERSMGSASTLPYQCFYGNNGTYVENMNFKTYHTRVNVQMLRNQKMQKLALSDMTLVADIHVGDFSGNDLGVVEMSWGLNKSAIYFNSSGTEGVLPTTFRDVADWSNMWEWQLGMMFNPTTGQVTGWAPRGDFGIPAKWDYTSFVNFIQYPARGYYDYTGDELVLALTRHEFFFATRPTDDTQKWSIIHSKHGEIFSLTKPIYNGEGAGVGGFGEGWLTGDLRSNFFRYQLYSQYRSGFTPQYRHDLLLTLKSDGSIVLSTVTDTIISLPPRQAFFSGSKGCDSSYDGRMVVEVFDTANATTGNGGTYVHAFGSTVAGAWENLDWPVLCGPQPFNGRGAEWDKIYYATEVLP